MPLDLAILERLSRQVTRKALDVQEWLRSSSDGPRLMTFVNPMALWIGRGSGDYLDALEKFDTVCCDGALLARLLVQHSGQPVYRQSFDGNSLAPAFFNGCAAMGKRVGLVGSAEQEIDTAAARLEEAHGFQCVFAHHGFLDEPRARSRVLAELRTSGADVVVVGMGAPRQERFLLDLIASGWSGHAVTCGAYLSQVAAADGATFYPRWANRGGMRAVYRLFRDPRTLLPRYFVHYWPAYRLALRHALGLQRRGRPV